MSAVGVAVTALNILGMKGNCKLAPTAAAGSSNTQQPEQRIRPKVCVLFISLSLVTCPVHCTESVDDHDL